MSFRESLAVGWAPIFLRLALGVTFLWAGLAKVVYRADFVGADAATLANYGVIAPPSATTPLPPPAPPAAEIDPIAYIPHAAASVTRNGQDEQDEQDQPVRPDNRMPDGSPPPALDDDDMGMQDAPASPPLSQHVSGGPGYTADQFPEPVQARSLHQITLMLDRAMRPEIDPESGEPTIALWFDVDATKDYDPWPVYFAWAVAGVELIGGGFLLLGLLTRLSALGIAGTMAGAVWLMTIGPAVQSGETMLGFLPNHELLDFMAWQTPLWQFSLLMAAFALFCTGSGGLSIDRLLFGNPFFYRPAPKKSSDD